MASQDNDVKRRADWSPVSPETLSDPAEVHERLRAEAPVAWSEEWGGFVTLMRHADVCAASRDPETFTATKMTVIPSSPRKGLPRLPLQKDPPDSDRYRKGLNLFFKENRMKRMEPELDALATSLFDRLLETPADADFGDGFAGPFTQGALCILVGMDLAEADEIGHLSHDYVAAVQAENLSEAGRLSRLVDQFAIDLVADRIAAPRDPEVDMVSGLMAHEPEGGAFTPEELAGMVRLNLIGGHVVPRNFLCSLAWHMASHPQHVQMLRHDPSGERALIEELLRFYSPNQALVRVATKDTRLSGTEIPQGCPVALNFLSANRDEEVFDAPMEFRPDRAPNRHIAFGIGPHMCIGQSLARRQARLTLAQLLRAPGLDLAAEPTWARWTEYGVTSMRLDLRGVA
ncbi:cytochrome P450 [Oceanicola sp. S124]|uniref:cytochrome P450 n=1 Tax=Oceanicola sp. S124 TaxID=1042378 RepID=UPI0002559382|nr:cytochrome P450 [Oceanicola sp. S124]